MDGRASLSAIRSATAPSRRTSRAPDRAGPGGGAAAQPRAVGRPRGARRGAAARTEPPADRDHAGSDASWRNSGSTRSRSASRSGCRPASSSSRRSATSRWRATTSCARSSTTSSRRSPSSGCSARERRSGGDRGQRVRGHAEARGSRNGAIRRKLVRIRNDWLSLVPNSLALWLRCSVFETRELRARESRCRYPRGRNCRTASSSFPSTIRSAISCAVSGASRTPLR